MSSLLLDTNVLIYSIDKDSKYFDKSRRFFSDKFDLFTTSKNLSEFLSVVTRIPNNSLSVRNALLVIEDFVKVMTILYPNEKSLSIFKSLLKKYQPAGLKIHDYEIISIALANNVNSIVSFNEKDFTQIKEIKLYPLN